MKCLRLSAFVLLGILVLVIPNKSNAQPKSDIQQLKLKFYPAGGLMWKSESMQNTCWNKICEDNKGRIWFAGGDHWGTDRKGGKFEGRYERPWGYGNTTVHYYDPKEDKAYVAFEINRASAIYSNAETPGHGKIHADLVTDADGNIWTGGYLGSSYDHQHYQQFYPKSYVGGSIIKYDPENKDIDYYGLPTPAGAMLAVKFDKKRNIVHGFDADRYRYWRLNVDTMELKRYELNRNNSREMIQDHEGNAWFANEFKSLTKFDTETETFIDFKVPVPDFRATTVSSKGIIYAISARGLVWCWDTNTNTAQEFGHVVNLPDQRVYTPNIALDEKWGRLYFMAGSHGINLEGIGMPVLSIFDIKEKKFHWVSKVDVDGCYGAVVGRDHKVYFGCYAYVQKNGRRLKDKEGKEYRSNYLVRYDPPENLEDLK